MRENCALPALMEINALRKTVGIILAAGGLSYGVAGYFYYTSLLLNSAWALANLITLVAAACVALEQPQQRAAPRVRRRFPCTLQCDGPASLPRDCAVWIGGNFGVQVETSARLVWSGWSGRDELEAAFEFREPDEASRRKLIELMFSGDDGWLEQHYPTEHVLQSLWYLLTTFWRVTRPRKPKSILGAAEVSPRRKAYLWKWIEDLR